MARETGPADSQPDREYEPLTIDVGAGRIIEGLETALIGMEPGDDTTVTVPPEDGYGEWSEERVQEFDPDEMHEMLGGELPDEGAYLETQNGDQGEITRVDETVVRVDFNSPLAGETLEFEIEILDVE